MKVEYELTDSSQISDELKELFSGCHINFLLGAGFSCGVLGVLENYEYILEGIRKYIAIGDDQKKKYTVLKAYMEWGYFVECIYPIVTKLSVGGILDDYVKYAENVYNILAEKGNPALNRQCNVFTTNYDPINEIAFEHSLCICNDGFEGRIDPLFSTDNFSKIYYREALFSNRKAEIPSVNLMKIHGSVTWKHNSKNDTVEYQDYRIGLTEYFEKYETLFDNSVMDDLRDSLKDIDANNWETKINAILNATILDMAVGKLGDFEKMLTDYENDILIVNPTKEKFSSTLLNKNYYELLRMYTNELEKENTLLIVFGFSFMDEHILDLTKRSLVNPSLKLIVFCFEKKNVLGYQNLFGELKNNNISYVYMKDQNLTIKEFNNILSNIHS